MKIINEISWDKLGKEVTTTKVLFDEPKDLVLLGDIAALADANIVEYPEYREGLPEMIATLKKIL